MMIYSFKNFISFHSVAPHYILQPELTLPCHKEVELFHILRDLVTLPPVFTMTQFHVIFCFSFLLLNVYACWLAI